MTSSWFFLSTPNYDARSSTHQTLTLLYFTFFMIVSQVIDLLRVTVTWSQTFDVFATNLGQYENDVFRLVASRREEIVAYLLTHLFTYLLTYILTYSLIHSTVKSPSWAANRFAASQEIPRISRNPKVHHRTHKRTPPVPIVASISNYKLELLTTNLT